VVQNQIVKRPGPTGASGIAASGSNFNFNFRGAFVACFCAQHRRANTVALADFSLQYQQIKGSDIKRVENPQVGGTPRSR
jgi:hypothetical protein